MVKWFGSITGIIGAFMLALNNDYSMYGYIFFILSSLALTYSFYCDKITSMLLQQFIFLTINCIGAYKWLF